MGMISLLSSFNKQLSKITFLLIALQISSPTFATIYYNKKVMGPIVSIESVQGAGAIHDITKSDRWRDVDFSVSPDGSIVFSSNRIDKSTSAISDNKEKYSIYLYDRSEESVRKISSSPHNEINPIFSPNGEMVLFVQKIAKMEELLIWSKNTGKIATLYKAEKILGYSWFENNKDVVFSVANNNKSELMQTNIEIKKSLSLNKKISSNSSDINSFTDQLILAPIVSKDSKTIAFILHPLSKSGARRILSLDLKKHETKVLTPDHIQPQEPLHWSKDNNHLLFSALLDYRFYYSEKEQKKVYEGSMHIFTVSLHGELKQISKEDHQRFAKPIYSPDEKKIAFLHAPQLGEARELTLETFDVTGENRKTIVKSISPFSQLHWR